MGPLQEMARIRPQRAVVNVEEEAGSHTDRQRWEKERTGHEKGMTGDGSTQTFRGMDSHSFGAFMNRII